MNKTICLLFLWLAVILQSRLAYGQSISMEIPDAYTRSADSLAFYIDSNYKNDEIKLRTLYHWITTHMHYNVFPTFVSVNEQPDENREIARALQTREGVCRQFALIFQAVSRRMDIPAFFVEGYTKQNGVITPEPHAWCVAYIAGQWYNYDPTFGMGYVKNQRFVPSVNDHYCKVEPKTFLQTHMPFDPIWQLVANPYPFQVFDEGKPALKVQTSFNFNDSIRAYLTQTPLQRLQSTSRRIKQNGQGNRLVDYYMQLTASNINVYRQREVYDIYKNAMKHYNRGVDNYNDVVRYCRTNRRISRKERENLILQIEKALQAFNEADKLLQTAQQVPEQYATAINNLKTTVVETTEKAKLKKDMLKEQN